MNLDITLIGYINDGVLSGKSTTTLGNYKHTLTYFTNFLKLNFLPLEVDKISSEIVTRFILWGIRDRKWNKTTQADYYKELHAFFNWCCKRGFISVNPLTDIPKPKLPPRFPKALQEEEVIELLRAVSGMTNKYGFSRIRNKAIIATLVFTGLRRSELLGLRVEDVDLKNGFIFVQSGKGGKNREIPIEPTVLKPILEEYSEYRERLGKSPNYYFNGQWTGTKKDNPMGYSVLDRLFRELSKTLNKNIHAHKLRHSFATLLLDKSGGDIYTLQQLMGHTNIQTTAIYLSSSRRKKVEVIGTLKLYQDSELS